MQDPHVLINAYIDDAIDDERFEQLCDWLRASPANRIAFAKATSDHAAIAEWAGERSGGALTPELSALDETQFERSEWIKLLAALDSKPGQAELVELVDLTEPFSLKRIFENRSALAWTSSALVAAAVLLGVLFVITLSGPSTTPNASPIAERNPATTPTPRLETKPETKPAQAVATLTATHNAQWAQAEGASAPGSHVRTGDTLAAGQRLNLTHGFAEITTQRGAIAILEAPATIELLDNDNALHLHAGKLVGICETPSSKGFLVRTPHMDITDLGTRFGVDASREDATEVHVFDGKVELTRPAIGTGQATRITLYQGQAARTQHTSEGFASIQVQGDRFVQRPGNLLLGTGQGQAEGEIANNWRVVAVDGQPVTQHGGMILVPEHHGGTSDPNTSQWLKINDALNPPGKGSAVFTCRSSFSVPEGINPQTHALVIRCEADFSVKAVRVNGQAIKVPNNRIGNGWITLTITDQFAPGENTIEVDVLEYFMNNGKPNSSSLRAEIEARRR